MLVGLTGNIASGKSTVAKIFESLGAYILNADEISKAHLDVISIREKEKLLQCLNVQENEIYTEGFLDRKKLGNLIFSNSDKKSALEKLLHPLVSSHVDQRVLDLEKQGFEFIIYESALLVETNRFKDMDCLIVVVAEEDLRIDRLMKRNSLTRDEALSRIKAQLPQENKAEVADYIIDNSLGFKELEDVTKIVFGFIKKLKSLGFC